MRMIQRLSSVALAVAAMGFVHTASAQTDAPNRAGGTVAAIAGLGIGTQTGSGAGFSIGVEGGYTLPMHLYIGGNFTYNVGKINSWLFEPQVGYDLALFGDLPIMIRPFVGLGYQSYSVASAACSGLSGAEESACVAEANSLGVGSVTGFVISPGAVGTYALTPHIYVGGEVRFDIGTETGTPVLINILGTGGYRF